jgi:hypothetical protein
MDTDSLSDPMHRVLTGSIRRHALHGHEGIDARTVDYRPSLLHSSRLPRCVLGN